MKPRLVRDDELDILPVKPKREPPAPRSEIGLLRTLSLPDFWIGSAKARAELRAGAGLCGVILSEISAGVSLGDSLAFVEWQRGPRS